MTQHSPNNALSHLRGDLFRQMQAHPYRGFLVARATEIAKEEGRSEFKESDVRLALAELRESQEQATSWSGFFYGIGSAILGVGVYFIVTALFFTPATSIQLLVAALLMFLGFLFLLVGVDQE